MHKFQCTFGVFYSEPSTNVLIPNYRSIFSGTKNDLILDYMESHDCTSDMHKKTRLKLQNSHSKKIFANYKNALHHNRRFHQMNLTTVFITRSFPDYVGFIFFHLKIEFHRMYCIRTSGGTYNSKAHLVPSNIGIHIAGSRSDKKQTLLHMSVTRF